MIGSYPIIYFLIDRHFGLLSWKSDATLTNLAWNIGFYGHIVLGGIALSIGWIQFSKKMRAKRIHIHRLIGKIYFFAVLVSGLCGVFIAQFATGGIGNVVGFSLSGILWLFTTVMAYRSIIKGDVTKHEQFMIYSYALCFSAVTLRVWLPSLSFAFGDFTPAYKVVGWLSWVPNLIAAYFIIKWKDRKVVLV